MHSRAEVKQAFDAIKKTRTYPELIPDSEIDYGVWRDREGSFGQVLDKIIETIDLDLPKWHGWLFYVDVTSRELLAYWSHVIDDIFRAYEAEAQGGKDYDGRWIKVGDEELRLTVEQIKRPVDATRYRVQRKTSRGTLLEESKLVFDLDEQGRLEESLNPLCITNQLLDCGVDRAIIEYEVRYRHGRIDMIKIVRRQMEPAGTLPYIAKTTEFSIPPVV